MKTVPPLQETELALTEKARDIILAYRKTDDRGQGYIARTAFYQAEQWPRRAKPTLRLVDGGTA
jgi:hypothetical protein